jgi:integrase/recombinase XerC/integrase/recombinase XerD
MLYETGARSAEVLALDVEDLDLPNRQARVRKDRRHRRHHLAYRNDAAAAAPAEGPQVRASVHHRAESAGPAARDRPWPCGRTRLSYQQAAALFCGASGGANLHQFRRSVLTYDAGEGTGTLLLMARSGHTSVRSLARYARVSAGALARTRPGTTRPGAGDASDLP